MTELKDKLQNARDFYTQVDAEIARTQDRLTQLKEARAETRGQIALLQDLVGEQDKSVADEAENTDSK